MSILACAQKAPPEIAVGELVGNYKVERKLAEGGMGTVYVANHILLPRRVALKILRSELLRVESARSGLVTEACILESMHDPRVARLFDAGIMADGRPWLAMELIEGECLADLLARKGKLMVSEVAPIVSALVDALAAAHLAGYVHSDVKPENVLLCTGDRGMTLKLVDWGIARSTAVGAQAEATMAVGTPHYMAPEQVRGEIIDPRSDVYSLGVLAYELLTGAPPFVGDKATELAAQHLTRQPQPIRERRPDVPPAIEALVHKMLAKIREERPMLETVRACFSLVTDAALEAGSESEFDDFEVTIELPPAPPATAVLGAPMPEPVKSRWTPPTTPSAIADHATLRLGRVVNSSGKPNASAGGVIPARARAG